MLMLSALPRATAFTNVRRRFQPRVVLRGMGTEQLGAVAAPGEPRGGVDGDIGTATAPPPTFPPPSRGTEKEGENAGAGEPPAPGDRGYPPP